MGPVVGEARPLRLLLDTNVFLWTGFVPDRLTSAAQRALANPDNELFVSVVTAWELSIRLGQLRASRGDMVERYWQAHLANLAATELPIVATHALATYRLPFHHRDPFDRMLIAQALVEGLAIVTADRQFQNYGVDLIW